MPPSPPPKSYSAGTQLSVPSVNLGGFTMKSINTFASTVLAWAQGAATAGGISTTANPPHVLVKDTIRLVLLVKNTIDLTVPSNVAEINAIAAYALCGPPSQVSFKCVVTVGVIAPPTATFGRRLQTAASNEARVPFTAQRERTAEQAAASEGDTTAALTAGLAASSLPTNLQIGDDIKVGEEAVDALSADAEVSTAADTPTDGSSGTSGEGVQAGAVAASLNNVGALQTQLATDLTAAGDAPAASTVTTASAGAGLFTAGASAVQSPRLPPLPPSPPPPSPLPPPPFPDVPLAGGGDAQTANENMSGGAIAGIVIGVILGLVICILCMICFLFPNFRKGAINTLMVTNMDDKKAYEEDMAKTSSKPDEAI